MTLCEYAIKDTLSHLREKPFLGSGFVNTETKKIMSRGTLKNHMIVHTGEKPIMIKDALSQSNFPDPDL